MNYTSVEQSKKLLELGLNLESADMWYPTDNCSENDVECGFGETELQLYIDYGDGIPCWSLGALRRLLPVGIKNEKGTTYLFSDHVRLDGTWVYQYVIEEDTFVYFSGSDINACFRMIVWLLENGNIKTDK